VGATGRVEVFQSHAGSIEAESESAPESLLRGFNPTLVRLRLVALAAALYRRAVSIPRWFD